MSLAVSTLMIGEMPLHYTVKRSKRRRRTLTLFLHPYDGLVLAVPWGTSEREVQSFILARTDWIQEKLSRFKRVALYRLISGEEVIFAGNNCTLEVFQGRKGVFLESNALKIGIKSGFSLEEQRRAVYRKLKQFCYEQGKVFLSERLDYWAKKLGVKYHSLIMTDPKQRWGSCDVLDQIRLNWRILLTPLALVDYLVVHELCHVRFKNHSQEYWDFVASVMPDHRERRKELHQHPAGFLRF